MSGRAQNHHPVSGAGATVFAIPSFRSNTVGYRPQLPVKTGRRFSMKAVRPSR